MRLQIEHSRPIAIHPSWDDIVALFSFVMLGAIVTCLVAGR